MATITAVTGNPTDVQTAINAANSGDTVVIPNGNYNWTTGGVANNGKYVIITAATLGSVTITDNFAAGDLFDITTSTAGHVTLAGIRFLQGSNVNSGTTQNVSVTDGAGQVQVAILHDCYFQTPAFQIFRNVDWRSTGGVQYNNTYDASASDGSDGTPGSGRGSNSDALRVQSNYGWYQASTLGNLDTQGLINHYIENCTFIDIVGGSCDVDDQARVVIRHCTFTNSGGITHGNTSTWGGRFVELYANTFQYIQVPPNSLGYVWVNLNRYWWCRGGTMRIWGNSVQAIWSNHFFNASGSWDFIDESLTRIPSFNTTYDNDATYPGTRWPGTGSNGTTQYPGSGPNTPQPGVEVIPGFVDPVYIWGNTDVPSQIGGGVTNPGTNWVTSNQNALSNYQRDPNPGPPFDANHWATQDVFQLGRDIVVGAAAPGYTPFVYPHPLVSGAPPPPVGTPGNGPTAFADVGITLTLVGISSTTVPGIPYPIPTNNFAALYSTIFSAQTKAGATEWNIAGYARQSMGAGGAGWSVAAYVFGVGVVFSNLNNILFPATSVANQPLASVGFCDALTGGNVDIFADASAIITVPTGIAIMLPAGGTSFTTY